MTKGLEDGDGAGKRERERERVRVIERENMLNIHKFKNDLKMKTMTKEREEL